MLFPKLLELDIVDMSYPDVFDDDVVFVMLCLGAVGLEASSLKNIFIPGFSVKGRLLSTDFKPLIKILNYFKEL